MVHNLLSFMKSKVVKRGSQDRSLCHQRKVLSSAALAAMPGLYLTPKRTHSSEQRNQYIRGFDICSQTKIMWQVNAPTHGIIFHCWLKTVNPNSVPSGTEPSLKLWLHTMRPEKWLHTTACSNGLCFLPRVCDGWKVLLGLISLESCSIPSHPFSASV